MEVNVNARKLFAILVRHLSIPSDVALLIYNRKIYSMYNVATVQVLCMSTRDGRYKM